MITLSTMYICTLLSTLGTHGWIHNHDPADWHAKPEWQNPPSHWLFPLAWRLQTSLKKDFHQFGAQVVRRYTRLASSGVGSSRICSCQTKHQMRPHRIGLPVWAARPRVGMACVRSFGPFLNPWKPRSRCVAVMCWGVPPAFISLEYGFMLG